MIKTDEGRRFTDEVYATKDEVKAIFNSNDVSSSWDSVISYRRFYDEETDLRDCENNTYKICLTKKLLFDTYSLQTKLLNNLLVYRQLSINFQHQFLLKRKMASLLATSRANGVILKSEETNRKLALLELESIPSSLFVIDAYSRTYDKFLLTNSFDDQVINNINGFLIGNEENTDPKVRKEITKDLVNLLKESKPEEISSQFKDLFVFLSSENIPSLLKALTIIYFFDCVRPYEYSNEETASLSAKAFMSFSGFKEIGYAIDFESIAYSRSETFFKRLMESEKSLDLTYYLAYVLPYIIKEEGEIAKDLAELLAQSQEEAKKVSNNQTPSDSKDIPVTTLAPNLALPDFPLGTQSDKISDITDKLLEVHPQLKRKQAHFFAGHCTISLHYTIEQFKEGENTVYETARTSMEDLANRGFYKKEKVGNKFVYTPIPLKENNK